MGCNNVIGGEAGAHMSASCDASDTQPASTPPCCSTWRIDDAGVELTEAGHGLAAADILTSKEIFAAKAGRSLSVTSDGSQLGIAIDWGRYGERFEYDATTGQLILDRAPSGEGAA
jgi:hypothetical protein